MGCFSFKCKRTSKPALSSSFDGTACHMFLLKDGKVIEEMFGNYDSYGRVFDGKGDSFKWKLDWSEVCDLMFDTDESNGIALILSTEPIVENIPTTRSDSDPNQGWGDKGELLGSISDALFESVKEPFHKFTPVMDFEKRVFIAASEQVLCETLPDNYDDDDWEGKDGETIDEWVVNNAWEPYAFWDAEQLWEQIDSVATTIASFHENEIKLKAGE